MAKREINSNLVEMVIESITDELNAWAFKRNLANYCYRVGFKQAGNYYGNESKVELKHAKYLQHWLNNRGVSYPLPLPTESEEQNDLVEGIKGSNKLELDLLNSYMTRAREAYLIDIEVFNLFNRYVKIQSEEIVKSLGFVDQLKLIDPEKGNHLWHWQTKAFK